MSHKDEKTPQAPLPPTGYQSPFAAGQPGAHRAAPQQQPEVLGAPAGSPAMQALEEKRRKKKRNRRIKTIVAILVILALLAFAGISIAKKMTSNKVAEQNPTEEVKRGEFKKIITTNGTIQPLKNQSVSGEMAGTVTQVMVAEGDTVKEGDVLFTFKSEQAEEAIRQAETAVKEARNGIKTAQMSVKGAINGYNTAADQYNRTLAQAYKAEGQALAAKAAAKLQAQMQQAAAEAAAKQAEIVNRMVNDYQRSKEQKAVFDQLVASSKAERGMSFKDAYAMIDAKQKAGGNVAWAKKQLEGAQVKPDGTKYGADEKIATIDKYWMNMILTKSQLMAMGIDPDSGAISIPGQGEAGAAAQAAQAAQGMEIPSTDIPPFDKAPLEQAIETAKLGVQSAQLHYENAQESLRIAKDNYNDGKVVAKISGQILALNIEDGTKLEQLVQSGKPAVQIANVSQMKAEMNVNELDILKVTKDLVAKITLPAIPGYEAQGRVTSIASSPQGSGGIGASALPGNLGAAAGAGGSAAVSYPVGVVLDNPDPRIKVGMSVDVSLTLEDLPNVLMVPLAAVNNDGSGDYVTRVTYDDKGIAKPEKVKVKVISSNDQSSVIEGDIKEGDKVEVSFEDKDNSPFAG